LSYALLSLSAPGEHHQIKRKKKKEPPSRHRGGRAEGSSKNASIRAMLSSNHGKKGDAGKREKERKKKSVKAVRKQDGVAPKHKPG